MLLEHYYNLSYNEDRKRAEILFAWSQFYQNGPQLAVKRSSYMVDSRQNIDAFVKVQKEIAQLGLSMYRIKN